jgi:hypothetical protein
MRQKPRSRAPKPPSKLRPGAGRFLMPRGPSGTSYTPQTQETPNPAQGSPRRAGRYGCRNFTVLVSEKFWAASSATA